MSRLETRPARDHDDVAAYFDESAASYRERHGDAGELLRYRLDLLREAAGPRPSDEVLEIGCGPGLHLLALAGEFARGVGVDLSPAMVEVARERAARSSHGDRVSFAVDAAERLDTIADASMDVVLCVGALEHMLDPAAVLSSAHRVLRPGGRFACLTLNGGSLWYRYLAPALGVATRRLSTDHYPTRDELRRRVAAAGFGEATIDFWTFVQRGEVPRGIAGALAVLERLGTIARLGALRGGLRVRAVK